MSKLKIAIAAAAGLAVLGIANKIHDDNNYCARLPQGLSETHDGGKTFTKMHDSWTTSTNRLGTTSCVLSNGGAAPPEFMAYKGPKPAAY